MYKFVLANSHSDRCDVLAESNHLKLLQKTHEWNLKVLTNLLIQLWLSAVNLAEISFCLGFTSMVKPLIGILLNVKSEG